MELHLSPFTLHPPLSPLTLIQALALSRYDPADPVQTPFDVQRRIAAAMTVLPPLEEDRFRQAYP